MKRNPASNKFRRDVDLKDLLYLIHLDLLRIRAAMSGGSAPSGGDDAGDVTEDPEEPKPEELFVPIMVGLGAYIKSTDVFDFADTIDGSIPVYANSACTVPAEDGVYDYDGSELENYEGLSAYPVITGFSVSGGVIDAFSFPVEEE